MNKKIEKLDPTWATFIDIPLSAGKEKRIQLGLYASTKSSFEVDSFLNNGQWSPKYAVQNLTTCLAEAMFNQESMSWARKAL